MWNCLWRGVGIDLLGDFVDSLVLCIVHRLLIEEVIIGRGGIARARGRDGETALCKPAIGRTINEFVQVYLQNNNSGLLKKNNPFLGQSIWKIHPL